MERFVGQQNVERFQKLLDRSTDEPQRRMIFKLLAEEQEKLSKLPQLRQPWFQSA